MSSPESPKVVNIPGQIIEKFLSQLAADQTSSDVIARLKKTLLEKKDFSESALRSALTPTPKDND